MPRPSLLARVDLLIAALLLALSALGLWSAWRDRQIPIDGGAYAFHAVAFFSLPMALLFLTAAVGLGRGRRWGRFAHYAALAEPLLVVLALRLWLR